MRESGAPADGGKGLRHKERRIRAGIASAQAVHVISVDWIGDQAISVVFLIPTARWPKPFLSG